MGALERYIYRLKTLRELGIAVAIGLMLLAIPFLNPDLLFERNLDTLPKDQQYLTVAPIHVKNNDWIFEHFMNQVSENKGVLVLGTSESAWLADRSYNYFDLLNLDEDLDRKFSYFGGAGRYSEIWLPLIVNKPEMWQKQEILVFVNPTYWRKGLNEVKPEYLNRYLSKDQVSKSRSELSEAGMYDLHFHEMMKSDNPVKAFARSISSKTDELRKAYFANYRSHYIDSKSPFTIFEDAIGEPRSIQELKAFGDSTNNISLKYKKIPKEVVVPCGANRFGLPIPSS